MPIQSISHSVLTVRLPVCPSINPSINQVVRLIHIVSQFCLLVSFLPVTISWSHSHAIQLHDFINVCLINSELKQTSRQTNHVNHSANSNHSLFAPPKITHFHAPLLKMLTFSFLWCLQLNYLNFARSWNTNYLSIFILLIKINISFCTFNRNLLTHSHDTRGNFDREQFISRYIEVREKKCHRTVILYSMQQNPVFLIQPFTYSKTC